MRRPKQTHDGTHGVGGVGRDITRRIARLAAEQAAASDDSNRIRVSALVVEAGDYAPCRVGAAPHRAFVPMTLMESVNQSYGGGNPHGGLPIDSRDAGNEPDARRGAAPQRTGDYFRVPC